jgi:hypothetical protein
MEAAKGFGEEAVCTILKQYSTQNARTEPTEVSQQL